MEDLPLGRIAALVPELAVKDLPLGRTLVMIYRPIWGRKLIEISGSLIWSKTLMEPIFNPCGECRWSPKGPVSQIHSPHLHVGAPGNFTDLLRSVQMLDRESGVHKAMGSYRTYPSLVNCSLGSWVCGGRPAFEQNCGLGSWVCCKEPALGQNTLMMVLLKQSKKKSIQLSRGFLNEIKSFEFTFLAVVFNNVFLTDIHSVWCSTEENVRHYLLYTIYNKGHMCSY